MVEAPILVLGATRGQGGAVADALLARGARVRAIVRRPTEPKARRLPERGVEVLAARLATALRAIGIVAPRFQLRCLRWRIPSNPTNLIVFVSPQGDGHVGHG
jgi:NAD(P)-dependent dehydrogenase (short-subunit alcohol dehydrogenase family)